jgi:hypothetical protein
MTNNEEYLALLKINQTRDEFDEKVLMDKRSSVTKMTTYREKGQIQALDKAMETMVANLDRKSKQAIEQIMDTTLRFGVEAEVIFDYRVDGVIKDEEKGKYMGHCHVMFMDTVGYSALTFSFEI